jgi:hypothetical protein
MRRAACSPIIIAGAFVLPPGMAGMIDASATRRPSMPRTPQFWIHHGAFVGAHPAGAGRVVHRGGTVGQLAGQRGPVRVGGPGLSSSLIWLAMILLAIVAGVSSMPSSKQ